MPGAKRRAPKGQGLREPERPRMAVLSDLLDFPHHTCARGSKVERAFLEDLARALEIPRPHSIRSKEALVIACAVAATGGPVDESKMVSPGGRGTIKNEALDVIIDGLIAHGRLTHLKGGVAARVAAELDAAERDDAEEAYNALDVSDERRASLRRVVDRPGQKTFHDAVLAAYPGCAITGCLEGAVLDAAHIRPYKGPRTNKVPNGICLRSDLHRLWDRGLLAVHEVSHRVLLHPQVNDSAYLALAGAQIALPLKPSQWPDSTALRLQREWCDL